MVRWRYSIVLALLLLLPVKTGGKLDEEDDEEKLNVEDQAPNTEAEPARRADESEEEEEDDDDDDDEDPQPEKSQQPVVAGRRAPAAYPTTTKPPASVVPRTEKKRPLECYVCAYKSDTPMRSCLDPTKYRVHTLTCHNAEDKCFTSIMTSKHNSYETVIRGCRSNCVGSPDITCCETNRCNNQALALPAQMPKSLVAHNKSDKTIQPTVLFFVTILLVLQTVVRVAIV